MAGVSWAVEFNADCWKISGLNLNKLKHPTRKNAWDALVRATIDHHDAVRAKAKSGHVTATGLLRF